MFTILELDRPRKLRYGMGALILIEELTGKAITQLDMQNIKIGDLAKILYAGLYNDDKALTVEKVVDLIDEHSDITTVSEKLGEAMTNAFGKNDKKTGE